MKKIVVSAVNLTDGGTFSILNDLLDNVSENKKVEYFVLVNSKFLFNKTFASNVKFIEYSNVKSSWLKRILFEYVESKKIALSIKPTFWLSLHDMSPNLPKGLPSGVYCHNPTPFAKKRIVDLFFDYKYFLFTLFYKYLYKININKNKYVFVQQQWIASEFSEFVSEEKLIVAKPDLKSESSDIELYRRKNLFFFPSYPRPFKNFEVILKAVEILEKDRSLDFEVQLTIDGTENLYTKLLVNKYKNLENVIFLGKISRKKVNQIYQEATCLIFPSKLETWGLPITEAKKHNLMLLVADLPYAKETVADYDLVSFFKPDDAVKLAELMRDILTGKMLLDGNKLPPKCYKTIESWKEFLSKIETE